MTRTLRIGLTGGIASGKSTLATLFSRRSAPVIDTDCLARQVVKPGSEGLEAIQREFGEAYISPDGRLDRARMAELIFTDGEARQRLEQILHPLIRQRVKRRLEAINAPYALIVVPLLVETGMYREMDKVLVIDISEHQQLSRLTQRDGLDTVSARQRLSSQANRDQRRAKADEIIHNEGSITELEAAVSRLHLQYTSNIPLPPGERPK